jgi:CheY-like chemotaxis protein
VDQARILIVDDEPFNLDVLEEELELLGHVSVRATDGEEALERLKVEPFDLMLLDVMMPRLDGYGVLERMRSEEAWWHIPLIMISALTDLASSAPRVLWHYTESPKCPRRPTARPTASIRPPSRNGPTPPPSYIPGSVARRPCCTATARMGPY